MINNIFDKIDKKMRWSSREIGIRIPYKSDNGKFDDMAESDIYWWTNGFYPGILWLMYEETGFEQYRHLAEELEEKLDAALYGFTGLHHDVGFMWLLSAIKNYTITGNEKSKIRGLIAASHLAARYNIKGGFIRAWNGEKNKGWAIIDCMMNIPLLYWASQITGDERFRYIAESHADKTIQNFIRPDGSVNHIVVFDTENGDYLDTLAGQGYEKGSSWSRGQAWAINGFMQSYKLTGKQEYLYAAKRVANYFIANISDDYIPRCDFRQPKEPVVKDSTAGVIAASGLIDIASCVGEYERNLYLDAAINIIKAYDEKICNWSESEQAIVTMGTESYHNENRRHIPIIYGDYYFIESVIKFKNLKLK